MFFFKPKVKDEDILPPPPPPDIEIGEGPKEKLKLFDATLEPSELKSANFPEEGDFSTLIQEMGDINSNSNKEYTGKHKPNKPKPTKQLKIKKKLSKKELKKAKKTKPSEIKQQKTSKMPKLEQDFGIEDIDFELPKDMRDTKEGTSFPDTLEDFDIGTLYPQQPESAKSKEIAEAEEEIKSAIEKIKEREKPSFFKRLFSRKKQDIKQAGEERITLPPADSISAVQSSISRARQALMDFDLAAAKNAYADAMKTYNGMSPAEQAKVYNDIKELYSERKAAEMLKV